MKRLTVKGKSRNPIRSDDMQRRLLVLSCSQRKRDLNNSPAIDVYDGPFFRSLRKNMQNDLDVMILSAKYGLIDSDTLITKYDQKMTRARANSLRVETTQKLRAKLDSRIYVDIFFELGKIYLEAIGINSEDYQNIELKFDKGPRYERAHNLKEWLMIGNKKLSKASRRFVR